MKQVSLSECKRCGYTGECIQMVDLNFEFEYICGECFIDMFNSVVESFNEWASSFMEGDS